LTINLFSVGCGLNYTVSINVSIQMAAIQFVGQISTRTIGTRCLCKILNLQSPLEKGDLICRLVYKHKNTTLTLFSSFPKLKIKVNTRT